jgi:hypothetical protein
MLEFHLPWVAAELTAVKKLSNNWRKRGLLGHGPPSFEWGTGIILFTA